MSKSNRRAQPREAHPPNGLNEVPLVGKERNVRPQALSPEGGETGDSMPAPCGRYRLASTRTQHLRFLMPLAKL